MQDDVTQAGKKYTLHIMLIKHCQWGLISQSGNIVQPVMA